jgi:hypothetical protein
MGVDGAVQHGLSMTGFLLILILFTSYFLLMFVCSHFSASNGRWQWRDVIFPRS